MQKSRVELNGFKKWKQEGANFTEDEKAILEAVRFPKELASDRALQRRVKKDHLNGFFNPKSRPSIEDVSYIVVTKKVAANQITRKELKLDENKRAVYLTEKEFQEKERTVDYEMVYCDANFIESELEWLFGHFAAPKPTPNATTTTKANTTTKLTKKQKDLVDKLIAEQNDAVEVSEQTGIDKQVIIDHLKDKASGKE
jgi:hypothetical protein